jgi:hypothetical protein
VRQRAGALVQRPLLLLRPARLLDQLGVGHGPALGQLGLELAAALPGFFVAFLFWGGRVVST